MIGLLEEYCCQNAKISNLLHNQTKNNTKFSLVIAYIYKKVKNIKMFKVCRQASNMLMSSYDETGLISGISDIIVVKWDNERYKSTPFLACFGSLAAKAKEQKIRVHINDVEIQGVHFQINKYGYIQPFYPQSDVFIKFNLNYGKNSIKLRTTRKQLQAQIYLFSIADKIIISDLDGTMTKTDLMGLVNNYRQSHYLHDGYQVFVNQLHNNGYKIVWLTMRSMSMYNFSKKYIKKFIQCQGALITEPEEFLPSVKKQIMKETSNIKYNMLKKIRGLFPEDINPFAGGLGNRENDALAYTFIGMPKDKIFVIFENSDIITLSGQVLKSYVELHNYIQKYFPPVGQSQQKLQTQSELGNEASQRLTLDSNQIKTEGGFHVRRKQSKLRQFFKDLEQENSILE